MRIPFTTDMNARLIVGATVGLVALDLHAPSVETSIAAIALAIAMILYLSGRRFADVELFIFVLAEMSPISLHASLPVTLLYQTLSITLLLALCVPLHGSSNVKMHTNAALKTLAVATIPFLIFSIIVFTRIAGYSTTQLLSFSALAFLAAVFGLVTMAERNRASGSAE